MTNNESKICKNCKEPIAIRNPSGYCDHLYYPENCEVCSNDSKLFVMPVKVMSKWRWKLKHLFCLKKKFIGLDGYWDLRHGVYCMRHGAINFGSLCLWL